MKIQKYYQLTVISSLTLLLIVYIQFKKTIQARTAQENEQTAQFHTLKRANLETNKQNITTTKSEHTPDTIATAESVFSSSFSLTQANTLTDLPQDTITKKIMVTNGITKNDVAYKKMGTHHPEFETKINGIVVQPSDSITIDTAQDHLDITCSYTFKKFGRIIKQDTLTVSCPLIPDNHNVVLGFSWHKTPHVFLLPQC